MPYLEPGRKKRRPQPSATLLLWLIAVGIALVLALQVIR
jgi:hypothetical protein